MNTIQIFTPPEPASPVPGFIFRYPRTNQDLFVRNETNDCTVVAAMHALRLDYSAAHEMMERLGRQRRKGFWVRTLAERKLGLIPLGINKGSVRKVLPRLPKESRYVVRIRNHVFAVADGVVFDAKRRATQHVREVYKVTETESDWII